MASREAREYVRARLGLVASYRALGLTAEAEAALRELLATEERREPMRPDVIAEIREASDDL